MSGDSSDSKITITTFKALAIVCSALLGLMWLQYNEVEQLEERMRQLETLKPHMYGVSIRSALDARDAVSAVSEPKQ